MAYNKFFIFYLFLCNVDLISGIIYPCNQTADCGCSENNANVHKIVGGEDAFPSSWGWAVSLRTESGSHYCTGSIVSPLHIITAAHCIGDAADMETTRVVVGIDRLSDLDSETIQVRSVNATFVHPGYNKSTQVHDIAVIRLNELLNISTKWSTARLCLPRIESPGKETDYPADSASLVAIGWGKLHSEDAFIPDDLHLQQVTVTAVPLADPRCEFFVSNSSFQFCAGVDGGGKGKKEHFLSVMKVFFYL
jgi:secreted trypsin-like serine protease